MEAGTLASSGPTAKARPTRTITTTRATATGTRVASCGLGARRLRVLIPGFSANSGRRLRAIPGEGDTASLVRATGRAVTATGSTLSVPPRRPTTLETQSMESDELLAFHPGGEPAIEIEPAPRWRDWMNATNARNANRCLPLL